MTLYWLPQHPKLIQMLFGIRYNDVTNAFKAYRKEVIESCYPLISRHYNLTVELPLKAIVRGFKWRVIPITWRNRRTGLAKFKIEEIWSRYLFIILYVWLERFLCGSDFNTESKRRANRFHIWRRRWKNFSKRFTRPVSQA